jgi:hypothetical protein
VQQTDIVLNGTTELVVTTQAGVPGGPYLLEVENPGGAIATSAFSYGVDPDPLLLLVDPGAGPGAGGNTLQIHGSNLDAASPVLFGVDPQTGAGGTPAATVTVIDASTLEVVAPAHAFGTLAVLVRNDATGQAALLSNAYTFQSGSGGGGGGGCYVLPYTPPAGPRELLAGAWWLFALLAFSLQRRISWRGALHLRPCPATSSRSTSR